MDCSHPCPEYAPNGCQKQVIMKGKNKFRKNHENSIHGVGITDDSLTGRGGLAFLVRYIKATGILGLLASLFKSVRKSRKGREIHKILEQLIFNAIDGTKQTITRFDELKKDKAYLKTIETCGNDAVSSHIVKRFFYAITSGVLSGLQGILLKMFIWRLNLTKPKCIILGADTMVLDNDDARKREGVSTTYKLVNGYHPLFLYWGRGVVNMAFHEGSWSPNHNNDYFRMVRKTVEVIRREYRNDVPIIIVSDAGFYDGKYFQLMEELGIFFVCGGRLMDCVKMEIMKLSPSTKKDFTRNENAYSILDFKDKREKWSKEYRAVYYKQAEEGGELHLEFDRRETLVYTNLMNADQLSKYGIDKYMNASEIVNLYQLRARDELVNRCLKEFAEETLPFKGFLQNAIYYYIVVISNNLLNFFLEDVQPPTIGVTAYPDTVRRLFIDIAGKIVCSARSIILKFERGLYHRLKLNEVWERCQSCVPI